IFILSYYNVVAGWAFGYFVEIVFGSLLQEHDYGSFFGSFVNNIRDNFLYSLGFLMLTGWAVVRGIQKGIETANKILMPALFFFLLCFAALPSCISLLELPVAYFVDQKKFPRRKVVWILCAIIFVLGLPSLMSFGAVSALNKLSFYKDRDFLTFIADITDITL